MLAKIVGAIMLVLGVSLAFSTFGSLMIGAFTFIGLAVRAIVVALLLYVSWRLIDSRNALGKILGAFLLVGGLIAGFHSLGAVVVGILGAIGLAVKAIVVLALLYFGWQWLKSGEFSSSGNRRFGNDRW